MAQYDLEFSYYSHFEPDFAGEKSKLYMTWKQAQDEPSLVSDSRTCFGRVWFKKFMDEFFNINLLRYFVAQYDLEFSYYSHFEPDFAGEKSKLYMTWKQAQDEPSLVSDSRTCFGRVWFKKFMDEFFNINLLRYFVAQYDIYHS